MFLIIFLFCYIGYCVLVGEFVDFVYLDIVLGEGAGFVEAEVLEIAGLYCFVGLHAEDVLVF